MALTSPWNVAFWLAAIGRPEMSGYRLAELLTMAAAVIAGALTWGIIWASSVTLLGRRASSGEVRPLVDLWRRFRHRRADGRFRRAFGDAADRRIAAAGGPDREPVRISQLAGGEHSAAMRSEPWFGGSNFSSDLPAAAICLTNGAIAAN